MVGAHWVLGSSSYISTYKVRSSKLSFTPNFTALDTTPQRLSFGLDNLSFEFTMRVSFSHHFAFIPVFGNFIFRICGRFSFPLNISEIRFIHKRFFSSHDYFTSNPRPTETLYCLFGFNAIKKVHIMYSVDSVLEYALSDELCSKEDHGRCEGLQSHPILWNHRYFQTHFHQRRAEKFRFEEANKKNAR